MTATVTRTYHSNEPALFVYVYCISQQTVLYWGIGFQSIPSLEGDGVFNVPKGDSPQSTEHSFIA